MNAKRVLLIGATGMVGGHVLQSALDDERVASLTVIGRRPTGVSHPKLIEIVHPNLLDYAPVAAALADQNLALFCLGAYTGTVPDDELRRVTVDYVQAFSQALHAASPNAVVCLLSGQGADSTERSRVAFARYKGMAENALLRQGFARAHAFRPGYIYPVKPRREPSLLYSAMRLLYPLARRLYPNIGIAADDLAKAMLEVGLGEAGQSASVLENADIRRLTKGGSS